MGLLLVLSDHFGIFPISFAHGIILSTKKYKDVSCECFDEGNFLLGAIGGDIIGSKYEFNNIKRKDFDILSPYADFTDDTVLTVAIAEGILWHRDFVSLLKKYTRNYPHRGYGGNFFRWALSDDYSPYNSWGNGAGMRVSPIGFAFNNLDRVLKEAKRSAEVTHNHPEGVKGAQAIASSIFLAREGKSKDNIKQYIEEKFGYDLSKHTDKIRPHYSFDVSCQGSVPESIRAFIDSTDYEDSIRIAISIGGDSDTIACMTGGIAEAFYGGIPLEIKEYILSKLPAEFCNVIDNFYASYID